MKVILTKRQFEVLNMKVSGMQDKQIAGELGITLRTAKFHAEQLAKKMKTPRGIIEIINLFGKFEMKPVWVPNPRAPQIVVGANPERQKKGVNSMIPEKDPWRTIHLPLNLWERLHVQFARILWANGEAPGALTSEEKKVRTAARVDAMEKLIVLCERTEQEDTFRV